MAGQYRGTHCSVLLLDGLIARRYPTRYGDRIQVAILVPVHPPVYAVGMIDPNTVDPFVSTEKEIEVDAKTAAAIEKGIEAADEVRVVSNEKVRKLVPEWISKFSTPNRP